MSTEPADLSGTAPSSTSTTTDPWTTEQETALLKALVQYKPVGLHAHFRMLAIRSHLVQSGSIDPDAPHTRIAGIWAKLGSLYDLSKLNEREDAVFTSLGSGTTGGRVAGKGGDGSDDDDDDDEEEDDDDDDGNGRQQGKAKAYWRDFELPVDGDGGFEALMWERRLAPEGTPGGSDWGESGATAAVSFTEHGDTATDEPRSSPVPGAMTGRGTRSGRKGRVNKLKDEMEVDSSPVGSGRASRRTSKATSEVDEDLVMEDADADEDDEGDGTEEESSEEDGRRGSVAKRGRGGRRGRGKRGRRRG